MEPGRSQFQLIAFDLDDTLYPELEFVKSGFAAVADTIKKTFNINDDVYQILWNFFLEGERRNTFNKALNMLGIADDGRLIDTLVTVYRSHPPHIHLYPDAREILETLRGFIKVGLITDGYLETQKNKVKALGIKKYFDLCILTDAEGKDAWKPNPLSYQKMMEYFSLTGEQCIYVGDNSLKDFKGAQVLGWKTVKIIRDHGLYRDVSGDQCDEADYSIRDLNDIKNILY